MRPVTLIGLWVLISVPLALVVGRALRGVNRPRGIAEEVESYLRRPHQRGSWLRRSGALVGAVTLVIATVVVGATAVRHLPSARLVVLPGGGITLSDATTTTVDRSRDEAVAGERPADAALAGHRAGHHRTSVTTPDAQPTDQSPAPADQSPTTTAVDAPNRPPGNADARTTASTDGHEGRGHHGDTPSSSTTTSTSTSTTSTTVASSPSPSSTTTTTQPAWTGSRDGDHQPAPGTTTSTTSTTEPPPGG